MAYDLLKNQILRCWQKIDSVSIRLSGLPLQIIIIGIHLTLLSIYV